jgi:ribosomal protein S18 acetylase RimI-like enzyme
MSSEQKIGMVRPTERFEVVWDDRFEVVPLAEERKMDVAELYHRTSAPLYDTDAGGTLAECLRDIDRYLDYHRPMDLYPLFLTGSTLVHDKDSGQLIAVCLMAGSPTEGHVFNVFVDPAFRRRGIATRMLKRALTVYADTHDKIDLEVDQDGPARQLYEKLGFLSTGPIK